MVMWYGEKNLSPEIFTAYGGFSQQFDFDPSFGPFSEGTMSRWPVRASVLFIVSSVDFYGCFTRKVSIRSLGLGKNCGAFVRQ